VRAEVLAGGRVVADTGERDLSTDGLEDFARLPYAAEVSLEGLPAGRYLLRVTAIDRAASAAVTQQVKFEIR
jgi:hypothetical protein